MVLTVVLGRIVFAKMDEFKNKFEHPLNPRPFFRKIILQIVSHKKKELNLWEEEKMNDMTIHDQIWPTENITKFITKTFDQKIVNWLF